MASGRVLLPPPREPWSGMRAGRYHVHPGGWPLRPANKNGGIRQARSKLLAAAVNSHIVTF